jgi:hypothetical protein
MKQTLTLTRWHKVAERINAAFKLREERSLAALTATTISPWNKEGIEEKARDIAEQARADITLVEVATAAVAGIRAALAGRNADLGISARLAEAEAANRRARFYRELIDKQRADMVRPEDVRHVPATVGSDEPLWPRRSGSTITLAIADKALIDELRAKLAREQARAHVLLDAIADANREKLELELADELLEIAGLAA